MALDGISLRFLTNEIGSVLAGAKAEKVYQPSKNELVLLFRTRNGAYRLFISCAGNSARMNLTSFAPDNPEKPPMLCMLLRKYLTGATLTEIRQQALDRIVFLDFDASNEVGDKIKLTLALEIMAQHSNIILIDGNGKIIDAFRRMDEEKSVREVLPNGTYVLPPMQEKENILTEEPEKLAQEIASGENTLSKEILNTLQGVSPLVARELASDDKNCADMSFSDIDILTQKLKKLKEMLENDAPEPTLILDKDSKPRDFSFMNIAQYGGTVKTEKKDSMSELLDSFFYEKDRVERTHKRAGDLYKILNNSIERVSRRINNQIAELEECKNKEQLRIFGELITANQYFLQKGAAYYDLQNYYDDNKEVRVPVNPALSPQKNAQKYYKDYKKAHTAEKVLGELIEQGKTELIYLESVLDSLSRAETEQELSALRAEIAESGYIKRQKQQNKKQKELPFIEYTTSDGFKVLVGRNNIQNDKLSFKIANNHDMWFHTKGYAGSHTVLISDKREFTDKAILEAARIAAFHSKAREFTNVPVDYTLIKNLRKPNGSPYGFVVYNTYKTILVNPSERP